MTRPGRLVILNGASSSGKTTLATAFRDQRAQHGEFWMLIGIDDFLSKLPVEWLDLGLVHGPGQFAAEGMRLEQTPDGPVLHMGSVCRDLLRSYRAAVSVAVRLGLDVIVDEVVIDEVCWTGWLDAVGDLDPVWVGIRCSPEVTAARELARGDRAVGMTSSQTESVHRYPTYAFELDTTHLGPDEILSEFLRQLDR
jgi:chloramphenicol 3-O phosphotransferase